MTEHTKGLLALFRNGQSVGSVDGYGVCELWPRSDEGFPNCEGKENGRRIVACWNLLDGYATEELEGVTLAEFVSSQPELAEKALIADYASIDAALAGKFPPPAWYLDGAKDFKSMMLDASTALFHPHIEGVFAVFERRLALDGQPQGGEPCDSANPSFSQA